MKTVHRINGESYITLLAVTLFSDYTAAQTPAPSSDAQFNLPADRAASDGAVDSPRPSTATNAHSDPAPVAATLAADVDSPSSAIPSAGHRLVPPPVAAPPSPPSMPVAGYDKGFFLQSPDGAFLLKIEGRLKTRYTFLSTKTPSSDHRENSNSFSVPLARLYLFGHLFNKKLSFVLQPEFGGGNIRLLLAFGDYAFIPNTLHLTFGQLKRPYARNYLVSAVRRAFIENPTGQFGQGIDIGLQLGNNYTKVKGLEWAVGVFNSADPTKYTFSGTVKTDEEGNRIVSNGKFTNAIENFKPALVARLGYNNGIKGYCPTDFEGGPFRIGVAASGHMDFDVDDDNAGNIYLSGDLILKAYGLSFSAAVYVGWEDNGNIWDDPGYASVGTFVQTGYLFGGRFEPVLRYGMRNPEGGENLAQETTVGFSFFFYKQRFKLENNFATFVLEVHDVNDYQFSSQLQLLF